MLCPGLPVVGPQLWSSGFLPGEHQGTSVDTNDMRVESLVRNLRHPSLSREQQREQLTLLQKLNHIHAEKRQRDAALEQAKDTVHECEPTATSKLGNGRDTTQGRRPEVSTSYWSGL